MLLVEAAKRMQFFVVIVDFVVHGFTRGSEA
jgi:hypothetical protein